MLLRRLARNYCFWPMDCATLLHLPRPVCVPPGRHQVVMVGAAVGGMVGYAFFLTFGSQLPSKETAKQYKQIIMLSSILVVSEHASLGRGK